MSCDGLVDGLQPVLSSVRVYSVLSNQEAAAPLAVVCAGTPCNNHKLLGFEKESPVSGETEGTKGGPSKGGKMVMAK